MHQAYEDEMLSYVCLPFVQGQQMLWYLKERQALLKALCGEADDLEWWYHSILSLAFLIDPFPLDGFLL